VSAAPDYALPVEGWRVWIVLDDAGTARLRSLYYDVPWEPESPVLATCLNRERPFPRLWRRRERHHVAPDDSCTCGIYAATERFAARRYLEQPPATSREVCRVLGRVALWGTVVECERGWRASYAYPTRLYLPKRMSRRFQRTVTPEEIGVALTRYAVPVETLD
jgi:hypothetical protein